MPFDARYRPETRHATLGEDFYDIVAAARFPQHVLRYRNQRWAAELGLGGLSEAEWLAHFGGFAPLPGSFEAPLALRYHGHQFRQFNPQLGDGRGFRRAGCSTSAPRAAAPPPGRAAPMAG